MADPKWKRFEKLIHAIHEQFAPAGAVVTLDDQIEGKHSGVPRQIDISIRVNIAHYPVLVVVECKDHSRPIDVGELGAFLSLRDDVGANKAVMISTSGFTAAAVEYARANGIETRTYVDSESHDWNTEVVIPVLLSRSMLRSWAVTFSSVPGFPMAVPTNIPFPFIETFSEDGHSLGPILVLLGQRWNHDDGLHVPGQHEVVLADHVLVRTDSLEGHARIVATINVERRYYRGPLRVNFAGFRNDQDGSILTQTLRTDFIEPARIERGEAPGWEELEQIRNYNIGAVAPTGEGCPDGVTIDGVPIEAMLVMHYLDGVPETPDEFRSSCGTAFEG